MRTNQVFSTRSQFDKYRHLKPGISMCDSRSTSSSKSASPLLVVQATGVKIAESQRRR